MKIGILGCDDVPERFRHLGGTYLDMFRRLLSPHVPDLELEWFDTRNGELPASAVACDAYVCTGSRHSVYDDLDWIEKLKRFVRTLYEEKRPFVGICFGHQMLAEALGGDVKPAGYGWGVGVLDMEITQTEPWMDPPQAHAKIQYMHSDQVERLPPGSFVLARAPHCAVAMFRVGETMLGIEGHPEFPASYVAALVNARRERIGEERAAHALANVEAPVDAALVGRWIGSFIAAAEDAQNRDTT
jgi:GMP synthase-like glutamine amidotransferase